MGKRGRSSTGLQPTLSPSRSKLTMFASLFAIFGTVVVLVSQAAGPVVDLQAEQATLSGGATAVSDTTASGGNSLKFGAAATTGLGPWYEPIPANPAIDVNSAVWSGYIGRATGYGADTVRYFNGYKFGMPTYYASSSDPFRTVTTRNGRDDFGTYNPLRVPAVTQSSNGNDGWWTIIDQGRGLAYNCWQAQRDASANWSCQNGGIYNWPNPKQNPPLRGLGVGAGSLAGEGAITAAEAIDCANGDQDAFKHAIFSTSIYSGSGYRFPANKSDGGQTGGTRSDVIPEGVRFQLDPSINVATLSGITIGERCLARAMQVYGMYLMDTGDHALSITGRGEDLADTCRANPTSSYNHPGDNTRPGGAFARAGLARTPAAAEPCPEDNVSNDFYNFTQSPSFPWDKLRVLRSWDGS